jgi:hypothetical protein
MVRKVKEFGRLGSLLQDIFSTTENSFQARMSLNLEVELELEGLLYLNTQMQKMLCVQITPTKSINC